MIQRNAGLSLVELVVAIAIGGVVLATVMGSYLSLAKMKQNLDITRQIQREVNFAVMRISDRVRAYSVNYDHNDFSPIDSSFLPLGDDEFKYDEDDGQLTMNGAPLFSPIIEVRDLRFEVSPDALSSRVQARVKIEILVGSRVKPELSVPLRTTISSRLIE